MSLSFVAMMKNLSGDGVPKVSVLDMDTERVWEIWVSADYTATHES